MSYLEEQGHQPKLYAAFDTFGVRVGYIVNYSVNEINNLIYWDGRYSRQ